MEELEAIDRIVEQLREFLRLNYMTGAEVARRIDVRDSTLYSWLQGESRPSRPERITAFLKSIPAESGSGITPNGYQYREYKNWRGIPKPRRCPFCKGAKGEVRKARGGYKGVCPNCGATGPKRESYDEGLRAWNGRTTHLLFAHHTFHSHHIRVLLLFLRGGFRFTRIFRSNGG
jgi:hypothetical protein